MKEIKLKGGLNVPLFGSVEKFIVEDLESKFIGILSEDYFGLKPKFLASEGDLVRVGQPIVEDKTNISETNRIIKKKTTTKHHTKNQYFQ